MRTTLFLIALAIVSNSAIAQPGKENIEKLCGCFSVNFQYAETFSPIDSYKYHEREDMNAVELVFPVEQETGKISLQHLLIVSDTTVIKHWREEWTYEAAELLQFKGNKTWTRVAVSEQDRKGSWTQSIREVNDEPRYEGAGKWINNNGKTYWENTTDAPLPRREYTVRSDYNILRRTNKLVITPEGYVHEQDNEKISKAEDGSEQLIAQEKGYNTYRTMDSTECAIAKKYWETNELFWTSVRKNWDNQLQHATQVVVKPVVNGKPLYLHFSDLKKDWAANKIKTSELDAKVKELIAKFLQTI